MTTNGKRASGGRSSARARGLALVAVEPGGAIGCAEDEREAVLVPGHSGALVRSRGLGDAVRGIADPARIAVLGGSNGGLMVAVAVTQRPDLWCAACSLVPVTDMLRYHLSPYGETGLREYGDPDDPNDAAVLRAYSPYHNIEPGRAYPPTLVVAGANDMRCPAWHARKLVAGVRRMGPAGRFCSA